MRIYKYRHIIAKYTLIHLLFIMFLSIHFTAWGGCYTEDGLSLECIVSQEMHIVEEGIDRLTISAAHFEHSIKDMWMGISYTIGLVCPVFFLYFSGRSNDTITFVRDTLVRLSVRLDD